MGILLVTTITALSISLSSGNYTKEITTISSKQLCDIKKELTNSISKDCIIKNIDISTTNLEIKQDPKTGFYRVSVK